MKDKVLFILFLIFTHHTIYANIIVTSTTPIASIIAMLVKDKVEIIPIATSANCPHHYLLKPSDLNKIKKANIVIYIDDKFDSFMVKLLNNYNKNIIKISNFNKIHIINDKYPNWHIWLDLNNVLSLLKELSIMLAQQFPEISKNIHTNYYNSKKQIESLIKIKQEKLSNLPDVILLSDSLEYFFIDQNKTNIIKLYYNVQKSLKYINNFELILSKSKSKCIVLSQEQDTRIYKNFNATLIQLDSENWIVPKITDDLFYNQYLKMINQVSKCL